MQKVRNLLLSAVPVLMAVGCCVLSACKKEPTNYRGLNFGKYYLETSADVYIEIKTDHKAYLHNLDFSDFDPEIWWGNEPEWENGFITKAEVDAAMQGEKEFWYFKNSGNLCFEIKSVDALVYQISFEYNGTDELKFNGIKYIKK